MKVNKETSIQVLNIPFIEKSTAFHYNTPVDQLIENTVATAQGILTSTGAIVCNTGEFTGRSPKDKFIVNKK